MWTITYETKAIFFCTISTFGITSTISDGIKVSDNTYFYGNLFSRSTYPSISDIIIRFLYLLNGTAWHFDIEHSLILHIDRSIIPKCWFFHICVASR